MINEQDILKIRRLYNLSQQDMGRIAGVSQSSIFKIEKGYMGISNKTANAIAERLDITPERLAFIRGVYAELQSRRKAVI